MPASIGQSGGPGGKPGRGDEVRPTRRRPTLHVAKNRTTPKLTTMAKNKKMRACMLMAKDVRRTGTPQWMR